MMKNMKVMILVLAALCLTTGLVCAQPQDEPASQQIEKGECKERGMDYKERIFKELNLTPEQEKKLEENRSAQRDEMKKLRSSIKDQYAKLQEELKNPSVTMAALEPIASQIKTLQGQLVDGKITGILAVKEILTPEQFAKFQQMVEERKGKRKKNFQNHREEKE